MIAALRRLDPIATTVQCLMTQPRADIAHERRRMMQVRRALRALLDSDPNGMPDLSAACLACADYLVYSMNRLHAQDQGIHDRLRIRIPAADVDAHARLAELRAQQRETRRLIDNLGEAADMLRRSDGSGLTGFVPAAWTFFAGIEALAAQGRNPFRHYTQELLSENDWAEIAGVTDASRERENKLFDRVCGAMPEGINPNAMSAQH